MRLRWLPALLLLALASGCASYVRQPAGQAQGAAPAGDAWARVLAGHVDEQGRIDFAGISKDRADLDAYVAYVGAVSPETDRAAFPTPDAVLAYYLNAYNALAMYNAIESGIPPDLNSIKFRFFYKNRLLVGGRRLSLYRLENSVVRPIGDPRVHFALNCMVRGCPRLPREPFEAGRLDAQLDAAARLFFSEPRHVEPVPDRMTVRFSEILSFYTKDFLSRASSLTAYANRYRSEPLPEDWKVEFIPYDWRLNTQ